MAQFTNIEVLRLSDRIGLASILGHPVGQIFYVSSRQGATTNDGLTRSAPLAAITPALALCVDYGSDVVVAMEGHAETITGAAGIAVNKIGVTVLGEGRGSVAPTISYSTAVGASFDITAAGARVEGFVFDGTGIDALTSMINVSAAGVSFLRNRLFLGNSTNQATLGLSATAAASHLTIADSTFHGSATAGTTAAILLVGSGGDTLGIGVENIRILRNTINGAFTTSVGGIQQTTNDCTNLIVMDNTINNVTASSTKAMVFTSTTTGIIARNYCGILTGVAPITAAAMQWVGNVISSALAPTLLTTTGGTVTTLNV